MYLPLHISFCGSIVPLLNITLIFVLLVGKHVPSKILIWMAQPFSFDLIPWAKALGPLYVKIYMLYAYTQTETFKHCLLANS
jgi:hypothetical protein